MNDFSFITQLHTIRQQKQQLAEAENRLLIPLLTDLSDIPLVYDLFRSLMADRKPFRRTDVVAERKKFLFIALCFFAPGALAGHRLPHGLRCKLAKVLNTRPTFISDNIENVCFLYQNIKAYREELQYLYNTIENELITLVKIGNQPHETI